MARKKNSVSAADKIKQKQEELEEKKRQQAAKEAEKAAQKAAQKAASAASKVPSTTGKTGTGTTAKPSTSSSSTFTQAKKSTQKKAQVPVPELGAGTSVSETETEIRATSAPKNNTAAQKKASSFISRSEVAKTQTPKTTQKQTTNRGSFGTGSMVAREATGRRNFLDVLEQDSERTTSGSPNVLNARREEQLRYQYPANMKWLEEYTKERNAVDPFVNQNQNQPGAGLRSAYVDQRRREELAAAKRENDQAIIDEYESIPNYDFLSTYRNPLARRQAERKQELEPEYRKLKNAQTIEQLHDLGFSDDDIHAALDQTAYNNLEMADRLWNTAQENGINISDIASAFDEYNRELTARRAAENLGWESAGSIITNPIESLSGVVGDVANFLNGRPISPKYSYTDTVRETVGNNIDSKLGRAAYDLAMSGADMLTSTALGWLTGGGSAAAAVMQGLEKAYRVMRDSVGRGLNRDQIMAEGLLSGVSTALTEKLPLDQLSKLAKGVYAPLKALLWQGIAEGGQEVAEGALDTAIDMLVAGNNSSVALRYNDLLRNGYNTGEAIKQIAKELGSQGLGDFLGGAILGGGMGAVGNLMLHNNPIPSLEDTTNVPPTSPETTLNPATMARQNENAVADAVRQRAEIVQNIEALNNQIQEQTAPQTIPSIGGEAANTMQTARDMVESETSQEELTGHYLSEEEENALAEDYAEREAEEDAYAELDADGHTPEQRRVIEEYAKATDPDVKQWIDRKRNDLPAKPYRVAGSVPDVVAEIVKNDLGIDISGNTVGFDSNGLNHITNEHMNPGNGKHQITDEDLAKIGYVIEHPDDIATRDKDGNVNYSDIYKLNNNTPAPKIVIRKRIDGQYYVVEAVTDAKNHRNIVVSAFVCPVGTENQGYKEMFKGAYHVTNAADSSAPSSNVQDAHENSSSNANISLEDESVNTDQQTNSGSGRTLAAEVEREENPHIEMEIPEYGPEPGEATPGEEWEDRDRSAQYESPDRMKSTQAARNTLWSLPTVQQNVEMQKYMLEQEANGTFSADVVHNVDSVLKATEAIDKAVERDGNVDGLLNDILGNGTSIDNLGAVQQDELMMCLDMKLAEAAKTGDFTGVEEILRKTNTREHNIGQALQALAKYTNTSSAAISKANKLIDGNTDAYFRKPGNQGKKNTNAKLARALATMGNKYADVKAEVKQPTHAELLQQVRNTLEPEFASVDELISDSTIEQITALLEGNIPMWQLRDELEHYFKNGEFYTIYEGEEEMHKKSRELATALDRVVNGDPEKATPDPKTLQQIRDEINTLLEDSEYASIYDEFSDEDIEFLANRIFRGAGQDELVDRLNRKLATGHLGMSNEDLAEVVRLYDEVNSGLLTSEEEYDAMQAANKILASYLGKGTILERLNQWRYLCMLSAPSTHLKNIASNATWGMVTGIKDAVAAAGEEALQRAGADIQRTKAIINPTKEADRAILQGAYEAFNRDSYADYARGGSRYNDRSEIKQAQQVGSKAVNALANLNSNLLSKEDIFFGRMKYAQALAGYVKANGRTADVFNSTDPADMAFLKQAEEYALSEANKTTFHEENELAAKITQASRSASEGGTAGLNVAIEALMPFKRTTANIGKQFLVEYNPVVQFPKAIIQTMQKNGDVAGTIDSYAKGLTGTGLVALGLWLAKSGLMVARKDDDDKSDVLNEAQNYAITWTSEDGTSHSYTIDGLAPTAMLMCVGAELAEKGFTLEALAGMGESFLGNTLLSGFESVFNAIGRAYAARQYDPDKHIGTAVAADMVNSYASQYIPTLMGKVARTVDPIRRNTYYTGKTGDTDTLLGYAQKAAAKIPFLSKTLQPYVDAYGNEERQPGKNVVSRFLYNMLSIGYYSERERDAIQDKISELDQYSQSLDDVAREEMEKTLNSLFGSASKSYDGEKLTPEQYTQYQKVLGNNTVNLYNGMLSSERFQSLNPEGQAQLMHDLGLFANALSKKELFNYQPGGSSKYVKLFKAYEESGIDGVVDAYCDSVEKSQEKKANSESAAEPEGSNSQTIPEYNPMAATGVNYAETPEQIPEPQQQPAPKQEPIPEPEAPKYDSSKVFSSYGYVAPGGAAELKNAGYSDKERGQILFNDQKEPGKAVQRAKDKNGYAGVAAYYDLYDAADQAGDGNGKAKKQEIIDYLQSENESVDEINAWMDIFGWNHISDSGTRSLPMLEEDEEFAQAQLGQPTTNGMPIPELMATRTPVGRQKRITEGGTGVSLRGATGSGMPVDTGGTDTTSFYSRRDEMARPTAQIADELLGRAVSEGLGNQQLYDIIRDPADMRVYIQELGYDDSRFSDDDIKKMQQAIYQYLRYANSNVAI